jgi:hypothetical protein
MSKKDVHTVEHRQKAFNCFKAALETLDVCAGCAASGLLYVAVSVAQQRMKISWDKFLEVAKTIWDDVEEQQRHKQSN